MSTGWQFRQKPTIDDQIVELVNGLIENLGVGYEITSREIRQMMQAKYGTNPRSVLPSDYCYNRVNKGIDYRKKPAVFEFVSDSNMYRCLGSCPYNGVVYHRPKGTSEDICVGACENGVRRIFGQYEELLR